MKATQMLTAPALIFSSIGLVASTVVVNNRAVEPQAQNIKTARRAEPLGASQHTARQASSDLPSRWGNLLVSLSGADKDKVDAARSAAAESLKATQSRVQSNEPGINGLMQDTIAAAGKSASGIDVNSYMASGASSLRNYLTGQDFNAAAKSVLDYTSSLANNQKRSVASPVEAVAALVGRGTDFNSLVSMFNEGLSSMMQGNNLNTAAQAMEKGVTGVDWNSMMSKMVSSAVDSSGGVNWASMINEGISTLLEYA